MLVGDENRSAELSSKHLTSGSIEALHADHDRKNTMARSKPPGGICNRLHIAVLLSCHLRARSVEVERCVVRLRVFAKQKLLGRFSDVWLDGPPKWIDRTEGKHGKRFVP